jgi:hypothetical protein
MQMQMGMGVPTQQVLQPQVVFLQQMQQMQRMQQMQGSQTPHQQQ